jgi:hypothetical protein
VRTIVATCSVCGHEYERWFDWTETRDHLSAAHGLHLDVRLALSRRTGG